MYLPSTELLVPHMTQAEFTDKLETHHAFVKAKSAELVSYHHLVYLKFAEQTPIITCFILLGQYDLSYFKVVGSIIFQFTMHSLQKSQIIS